MAAVITSDLVSTLELSEFYPKHIYIYVCMLFQAAYEHM